MDHVRNMMSAIKCASTPDVDRIVMRMRESAMREDVEMFDELVADLEDAMYYGKKPVSKSVVPTLEKLASQAVFRKSPKIDDLKVIISDIKSGNKSANVVASTRPPRADRVASTSRRVRYMRKKYGAQGECVPEVGASLRHESGRTCEFKGMKKGRAVLSSGRSVSLAQLNREYAWSGKRAMSHVGDIAAAQADGDMGAKRPTLAYLFPSEQDAMDFVNEVFRKKLGRSAYRGKRAFVINFGTRAAEVSDLARLKKGQPLKLSVKASSKAVACAQARPNLPVGSTVKLVRPGRYSSRKGMENREGVVTRSGFDILTVKFDNGKTLDVNPHELDVIKEAAPAQNVKRVEFSASNGVTPSPSPGKFAMEFPSEESAQAFAASAMRVNGAKVTCNGRSVSCTYPAASSRAILASAHLARAKKGQPIKLSVAASVKAAWTEDDDAKAEAVWMKFKDIERKIGTKIGPLWGALMGADAEGAKRAALKYGLPLDRVLALQKEIKRVTGVAASSNSVKASSKSVACAAKPETEYFIIVKKGGGGTRYWMRGEWTHASQYAQKFATIDAAKKMMDDLIHPSSASDFPLDPKTLSIKKKGGIKASSATTVTEPTPGKFAMEFPDEACAQAFAMGAMKVKGAKVTCNGKSVSCTYPATSSRAILASAHRAHPSGRVASVKAAASSAFPYSVSVNVWGAQKDMIPKLMSALKSAGFSPAQRNASAGANHDWTIVVPVKDRAEFDRATKVARANFEPNQVDYVKASVATKIA